jgi:hypothetical protein
MTLVWGEAATKLHGDYEPNAPLGFEDVTSTKQLA